MVLKLQTSHGYGGGDFSESTETKDERGMFYRWGRVYQTGEPGRDVMGSQVLLMGDIHQLSLFRLKRGKEEKV